MFDKYLSPTGQGYAILTVGIVLLLFLLGAFSTLLFYVMLAVAFGLIAYGIMQSNLHLKIQKIIKSFGKKTHKKQ